MIFFLKKPLISLIFRGQVIDYVFPVTHYKFGLVIRDPRTALFSWETFTKPFVQNAWKAIFVMTGFTAILLEGEPG